GMLNSPSWADKMQSDFTPACLPPIHSRRRLLDELAGFPPLARVHEQQHHNHHPQPNASPRRQFTRRGRANRELDTEATMHRVIATLAVAGLLLSGSSMR